MSPHLSSLSTRDKARKIARKADREGQQAIDLSGVEFISRAFADEIALEADERGLQIIGAEGDVARMLDIVRE